MTKVYEHITDKKLGCKQILSNEKATQKTINKIENSLSPLGLFDIDYDVVLFGSIARYEFSTQSDIDWTLLIDGKADPRHYSVYKGIENELKDKGFTEPGTSGLFGQITFSQSLIHNIGGEHDTNHNLTRRILLLLESIPVQVHKGYSSKTYERVIKSILSCYISNDTSFESRKGKQNKVPRFLLNDVVRLWRTMCVDFAYKQKDFDNSKWGLRNIKLRMSRKMSYIKGLLLVYSCYKNPSLDISNPENIIEFLYQKVKLTPLEIALQLANDGNLNLRTVNSIIRHYDSFLKLISTKTQRDKLMYIYPDTAYSNKDFIAAREISIKFQKSIESLLTQTKYPFQEFIFAYGIF